MSKSNSCRWPTMQGKGHSPQGVERDRNVPQQGGERERFCAYLVLDKKLKSHPRLILAWGKIPLRDLGLRWSVGEDGGERAFSSFPWNLWGCFLWKWECKYEPHFTLETLFLYKKGDPKLEPHSNLVLSIHSHYSKCYSVKDIFIFSVILGWKWNEIQTFL